MDIVVFSLGIIFKDKVQGGSQKILYEVAKGLGERGHTVTIYCPYREDNSYCFKISDKVTVMPILPLKGTFPSPYNVSPFALFQTAKIISDALKTADLLYCHDGGLNIEFLKNKVPTVISLRDFCYSETLLGALNFNQDAIIVNSDHTYKCLKDSFARINPHIKGKVYKIYNGYDPKRFRHCEITGDFLNEFNLPHKEGVVIGFPHRPQKEKGFIQALRVLKELKKSITNIKLLIPLYMDKGISKRTDDTYRQIYEFIEKEDLLQNVIFHKWISYEYMAEYFSYCDIILCIGNFVEAFSNVSTEALMCSTPVVAANVATYKTMPIKKFLNLVDYDDVIETCNLIKNLILNNFNNPKDIGSIQDARTYIINNFDMAKCIDDYEKVFISVVNKTICNSSDYKVCHDKEKKYRLTSWCSYIKGRIYDDYKGEYLYDDFNGLFYNEDICLTKSDLAKRGISQVTFENALRQGIIIEDE